MMKLLLASLLLALAAGATAQASKPTELRFGNEPWRLLFSLGDLKPTQGVASRPDRDAFTYRNDRGVTLSIIVENAHAPATLASCRNVFARRKQGNGRLVPINEVQDQRGEAAIQEYDFTIDSKGTTVVHHNVFSCRVRGTHYIDVHASKMGYRPGDRPALLALVEGVKIVE